MHEMADWGAVELDAEGQALQAEIEERQTVCVSTMFSVLFFTDNIVQSLPLRPTKSFLTCSIDKLDKKDTQPLQVCFALWQGGLPIILPELLNFIK